MATAEAALALLRSNLGMGEQPPGSNHNWLTEWYGIGDVPWCAITMSRALIEAGFGTPDQINVPGVAQDSAKGTAYVPDLRQHYIDAGRYDQTPQVGDVVIFTWGPGLPIGDHTGMVEAWVDGAGTARTDDLVDPATGRRLPAYDEWDRTVLTLEGNHNDDLTRMRRSMAVIDGFGHPPYDSTPAPTPTPPTEDDDMASPHILLTYGSGIVLLHSSGEVIPLSSDKQVGTFLAAGCPVLDDLTAEQVDKINGGVKVIITKDLSIPQAK